MRSSRVCRPSQGWMRSSQGWMRSSLVWMRYSRIVGWDLAESGWDLAGRWMRSSRFVRVSGCQQSWVCSQHPPTQWKWGAAYKAVLNNNYKEREIQNTLKNSLVSIFKCKAACPINNCQKADGKIVPVFYVPHCQRYARRRGWTLEFPVYLFWT